MLQVSAELLALITARIVAPSVLVELGFPSGFVYATDAPWDITESGDTYLADAGLLSMSPPNSSPELSRDIFNMTFADVDLALRTILDVENVGTPVRVNAAFTNVETQVMWSEVLPIYHGKVSSTSWSIEDDAPTVKIECSGPLTKLHQIRDRTTTPISQQALYPADTSMAFAHDTEKTLHWGAL